MQSRESIWSVGKETKSFYFAAFILQFLWGTTSIALRETLQNDTDSLFDTIIAIWESSAPIAITSAAVAIVITELGRYLMVLARHLEERLERTREARRSEGRMQGRAEGRVQGLTEGRVQGLTEGRVETQKKWEAWNVRRLEAESKGLPFTEPPPSMPTE